MTEILLCHMVTYTCMRIIVGRKRHLTKRVVMTMDYRTSASSGCTQESLPEVPLNSPTSTGSNTYPGLVKHKSIDLCLLLITDTMALILLCELNN